MIQPYVHAMHATQQARMILLSMSPRDFVPASTISWAETAEKSGKPGAAVRCRKGLRRLHRVGVPCKWREAGGGTDKKKSRPTCTNNTFFRRPAINIRVVSRLLSCATEYAHLLLFLLVHGLLIKKRCRSCCNIAADSQKSWWRYMGVFRSKPSGICVCVFLIFVFWFGKAYSLANKTYLSFDARCRHVCT